MKKLLIASSLLLSAYYFLPAKANKNPIKVNAGVQAADTIDKESLKIFYQYLTKSLRYPSSAGLPDKSATVIAIFNVSDDNKIINLRVSRGVVKQISEALNNEVGRVLNGASVPGVFHKQTNFALPIVLLKKAPGSASASYSEQPFDKQSGRYTKGENDFKLYVFKKIVINAD